MDKENIENFSKSVSHGKQVLTPSPAKRTFEDFQTPSPTSHRNITSVPFVLSSRNPLHFKRTKSVPHAEIPEAEENDDFANLPTLCDTRLAFDVLHSQFPSGDKLSDKQRKKAGKLKPVTIPPVALLSQIYSVVKNRTVVDKELDAMKRANELRVFKLLTGKSDFGIMATVDYVEALMSAKENAAQKSPNADLHIFDVFAKRLLPNYFDVSISKDRLQAVLYPIQATKATDEEAKETLSEDNITLLVNSGFLLQREVNVYWLSIPHAGALLKMLVAGRKEIVSMLKRQKWKELLASEMETKNLRYSSLGVPFHLKDLIGQGVIETVSTTAGNLYRLAPTK
eukprot:TRINITY_DN8691_c0_g1_i2.p1 TRINITY_DN8691_c0_g1~~TRINITY_DN8691_c0_g1_i2.p1  ORF type:complete len:340 (-),score=53.78 TRINITY_DN8691_c0_g1_i2:710-1729(-)